MAAFRGGPKDHRHKTDLISQIQAGRRADSSYWVTGGGGWLAVDGRLGGLDGCMVVWMGHPFGRPLRNFRLACLSFS